MEGSKEVDGVFPDALREPILRKVQFSTISRIDNLGQYHCTATYQHKHLLTGVA